jgi:sulfate permease, SulP family
VVDDDGVVREKLADDPSCTSFILYDLEAELFFGAAPELERYLTALTDRAQVEGVNRIVVRISERAIRTSYASSNSNIFLSAPKAWASRCCSRACGRTCSTRSGDCALVNGFPEERIFPQGTDEDSATLAAIRRVYENLDDTNACQHCAPKRAVNAGRGRLYYRV